MVKYIHIPIPSSDAELMAAEDLASLLSRYSSTLRFIKFDESLTLGQYSFTLLYRSKDIENKNSECVFSLKEDTDEVVYFSRSAHLTAPKKVREAASNAHTIIIGSGSGNDKFNLYFDNIVRIICRDEKYLDTDLLDYIKSKETTELLFTKKIRLK